MVGVLGEFSEGIEDVSSVFRNLTVEKRPRKVLQSTTKAFLWVTKSVLKSPVAGDDLQNSVEIRVHVSSVAKWDIGLGEHGSFGFFLAMHSFQLSRECPNHVVQSVVLPPSTAFPSRLVV